LALAKKQLKSSRQFEMPVFEYTALDAKGKTTSGIIDADGARAARQKLRATGIFPVSIKESQEAPEKKTARFGDLSRYLTRVKPAEIAMLTRQLATLISAGFPLVSALEALLPQTKSTRLKTVLAQVKDAIVEGQSFAQEAKVLLRPYPNIREFFHPSLLIWSAPGKLPARWKLFSSGWRIFLKSSRI
jgi:general secretion pathway protein F